MAAAVADVPVGMIMKFKTVPSAMKATMMVMVVVVDVVVVPLVGRDGGNDGGYRGNVEDVGSAGFGRNGGGNRRGESYIASAGRATPLEVWQLKEIVVLVVVMKLKFKTVPSAWKVTMMVIVVILDVVVVSLIGRDGGDGGYGGNVADVDFAGLCGNGGGD